VHEIPVTEQIVKYSDRSILQQSCHAQNCLKG